MAKGNFFDANQVIFDESALRIGFSSTAVLPKLKKDMPENEETNPNPALAPGDKGGERPRGRRRGRRGGRGRRRLPGASPAGATDTVDKSEDDAPDTNTENTGETKQEANPQAPDSQTIANQEPLDGNEPASSQSPEIRKFEPQRREPMHREPARRELSRREPPRREPLPPPFQPAPVAAIHQAIDDVMQIAAALKQAQEKMEEVLELVELAERQKLADEREIDQLRRAMRQIHNRPRDRRDESEEKP